jgi:multiple sugar transport system permease protein
MPIISKIGSKTFKFRCVYALIFIVLILGAITMIYPFSLMLSGSFKSEADSLSITPYPEFWFDDNVLFQKYVESKYNVSMSDMTGAWRRQIRSWRKIEPVRPQDSQLLKDFLAWRGSFEMPLGWYALGHSNGGRMLPSNARQFRKLMIKKFDGDIDAYARETGAYAKNWGAVAPLNDMSGYSRRYRPPMRGVQILFREFKASRPAEERILFNLDGIFWWIYLAPKYTQDIREYNRQHGTDYSNYEEIFLTPHAPAGGLARKDWEEFVRKEISLNFIRLDKNLADRYRKWLAEQYETIAALNTRYQSHYQAFNEVEFPHTVPENVNAMVDMERFMGDPAACPVEGIEVYGPRQAFENYVAEKRNVSVATVVPLALPIAEADYHDAMADTNALRWEFSTRNYKHVLDHLLIHGRGVINTIIFCSLAIMASLVVNPLAAYALSRYQPPSTYKILLFCMATMAFPGEVTMIPGFLLLKTFPLWRLIGGAVAFLILFWMSGKFRPKWSESWRVTSSTGCALVLGFWAVPTYVMGQPNVSLLNTFAALVLPGMANGYFIFLLKGFFDSLPKELYEAADIDGASEWSKFWTITMSLSKPILAVIALEAFTSAYSAFMMALIIIPDQNMWTLMVWIFQLQMQSSQSVVYASLVIAAIPTFIVFVFCQNIIIRGIIVPVEK